MITVYQEVQTFLADTVTPVVVLAALMEAESCFLLESVEGGEQWGRYSVLGTSPYLTIRRRPDSTVLDLDYHDGRRETVPVNGDSLGALRAVLSTFRLQESHHLARFSGGAVGGFGYPLVSEFEHIPSTPREDDFPDMMLMVPASFVIFDNVIHTYSIIAGIFREGETPPDDAERATARQTIDRLHHTIRSLPPAAAAAPDRSPAVRLTTRQKKADFLRGVQSIKDHITAGDIIQAVYSDRFFIETDRPVADLDIYRALRYINPSPYMYYLKFGEARIIGASPEVMLRVDGQRVITSPIAGTRKRGESEQEDRRLSEELYADEKERAEHMMLVDLARNDIGRIAATGTVQVTKLMSVEKYSHVMHLVSCVEGVLAADRDCYDALRATFPAGTLSGAPKVRAMEIIAETERLSRGMYGGAVGYISFDGNMDTCITIRTLFREGERIYGQAGAGIVYDSVPEKEYEEIQNKFAAVGRAVQMAAAGLRID